MTIPDMTQYEGDPLWDQTMENWWNRQKPERQTMLREAMREYDGQKDNNGYDLALCWLDKVMGNELISQAEVSSESFPKEFQEASDRGDIEAMGVFLKRRWENQAAGLPWV
jgi:hypothetical protein